jgi:hypothetical protein
MKEIAAIRSRDVIMDVRKKWSEQYKFYSPDDMIGRPQERIGDINARLRKLDLKTCTVADVDAAIGTTGWADNECDLCGGNHELVVRVGDKPDYDARWIDLCPSCVKKVSTVSNGERSDG